MNACIHLVTEVSEGCTGNVPKSLPDNFFVSLDVKRNAWRLGIFCAMFMPNKTDNLRQPCAIQSVFRHPFDSASTINVRDLAQKGLLLREGTIVDATIQSLAMYQLLDCEERWAMR